MVSGSDGGGVGYHNIGEVVDDKPISDEGPGCVWSGPSFMEHSL
jgi:hypothetical protein